MPFPSSPVDNQLAIVNNILYKYELSTNTWTRSGTGSANVIVVDTANVVSTTTSTSTTTGALRVAGGAGIAGNVFAGAVYTNSYFYANGTPYLNTGFTGSAGSGFTGSAGTTGFTGSVGSQGPIGYTGSAGGGGGGGNGYTGSQGFTGSAGGSALYSRSAITATAGQTVFTVAYNIGYIQVFFNGALLNDTDYTATNGSTVTLTDAAADGDLLEFVTYALVSVAQTPVATINSTSLTANLAITTGYSAVSVGPINISSNVTVSIASGQKWVIL